MNDFEPILEQFATHKLLGNDLPTVLKVAPRGAVSSDLPDDMHVRLFDRVTRLGIERLYSHQLEAWQLARERKDLMVVTGTNSGKTLCYALPVMDTMCREPAARALFVYPTKALAQDQLSRLERLAPGGDVRLGTYDGDTPTSRRASLRKLGHILLTNPDMLHLGILPNHENWVSFLKNLRWIVLDEAHSYRGMFGAHVGLVLRRLLRLAAWHGARPQIMCCSATIGNPLGLFQGLTGRQPALIDMDGSPQGERTFAFCNPPLLEDQTRASSNTVTAHILADLCLAGYRALAFSRSRLVTELVLRAARDRVKHVGGLDPQRIESYRAGYTVKERREIEKQLFSGQLVGLVATNAMELGVDIGDLDAVVMNGYPGSVASFRQQSGRAGRGQRPGLAVLVAHDDPLEQFLTREPERLLEFPGESVVIQVQNPHILGQQLLCAAHERPLSALEASQLTPNALRVAEGLEEAGELALTNGAFYYPSFDPPAAKVNLRGSASSVRLMVDGEEIGFMERWRAIQQAHPGAVYLHRGLTYLGQALDLDNGFAILTREDPPYYTQPVVSSVIEKLAEVQAKQIGEDRLEVCGVQVTETMQGYRRKSLDGERVLDVLTLELPSQSFQTVAVRVDFQMDFDEADSPDLVVGLHGLEHALLAMAPLIAGCDAGDLGSAWYLVAPDTLRPALYVFDRAEGGTGLSEALFHRWQEWVEAAKKLVLSCTCIDGCPGCLLSPRCEINNEAISKRATVPWLLRVSET